MTLQERAKRTRDRYQARKALGLCPVCGRTPAVAGKRCTTCEQSSQKAKQLLKDRGTCQGCGKETDGSVRCGECRQRRSTKHRENVLAGLCYCGRQRSGDNRQCDRCLEAGRQKTTRLRLETINAYGGLCSCCGEHHIQFLQIDHINGRYTDTGKDPAFGSALYSRLRREGWPEGFQVLCANCNFAKGMYLQCPHAVAGRDAAANVNWCTT